ncbi:hypothetical protein A8990_1779 [Paenibacillus taihuensis]|uniref:Uncharacterized protein n=1 Tax=Paenibacillus taihuensis TaxID=1156355 RepID=A0A3D9PX60_9BACL|nr:hypothetical protein [Paenibacillus taihuensis]REE54740.1 hypothetical protein A8990_1779 [Paenibacillus taihuensis]
MSRAGKLGRRISGFMLLVLLAGLLLTACESDQKSVFSSQANVATEQAAADNSIPWDYRIVQGKVGDLVGSDMVILPDNTLLSNDGNYATGDDVWTLQYMTAAMTVSDSGSNQIKLSSWNAIKSYKTEASAKDDLAKLKVSLQTEVPLVGVYKTSYQGKSRDFAVITLPSGNQLKQPIDDKRYEKLKSLKNVMVNVEEVHDYLDYDLAYAKFRGWA